MSHRILVVDDEPDITALVAYHLAKAGYRVSTAANGPDALKAARDERPDIVVLDLMLPGVSGYDVLAEMRRREETRDVGVILLTARREGADRIRGLSLGADDYLTKPFDLPELEARVRALIRRGQSGGGSVLAHGALRLDTAGRRATLNGAPLDLSARELGVLEVLMHRSGRVVNKEQLAEQLYGWDEEVGANAIEVYVSRLRTKLGGTAPIRTVRGLGYRLDDTPG